MVLMPILCLSMLFFSLDVTSPPALILPSIVVVISVSSRLTETPTPTLPFTQTEVLALAWLSTEPTASTLTLPPAVIFASLPRVALDVVSVTATATEYPCSTMSAG